MGKFSLENRIRERLQGHEVDIDKQELWNSLGIEDDKKDRKVFWIWGGRALGGLLLVLGLWWAVERNESSNIPDDALAEVSRLKDDVKTGLERPEEELVSERLEAIFQEVNDQQIKNEEGDEVGKSTIPAPLKETIISNSKDSQSALTKTKKIRNTASQSNSNFENNKHTSHTSEFESEATDINSDIQKSTEQVDEEHTFFPPIPLIDLMPIPVLESMLEYHRNKINLDVEPIAQIIPVADSKRWAFELYGGVSAANRSLNLLDEEQENYLLRRDTSESVLEQIQLGASFQFNIASGFYGKIGVEMNGWNERFSYFVVGDSVYNSIEVPEVITIDLLGDSTFQYTEGTEIYIERVTWKRYNRLTQIDIPISMGYQKEFGRFDVFGELTANINLSQSFKGYLQNESAEIIQNPDFFKSNIGVNWGVGLGFGYQMDPRWRLSLSGRYYNTRSSVLNTDSAIDQRYTSVGARLGLGYQF